MVGILFLIVLIFFNDKQIHRIFLSITFNQSIKQKIVSPCRRVSFLMYIFQNRYFFPLRLWFLLNLFLISNFFFFSIVETLIIRKEKKQRIIVPPETPLERNPFRGYFVHVSFRMAPDQKLHFLPVHKI